MAALGFLAAVSAVGLAGFTVILVVMARFRLMVKSESLNYALLGFLFLTAAQALSTASYYAQGEALAYSLYVGSSTSASMGYAALALASSGVRGERRVEREAVAASLLPILALPLSTEALAAVFSALATHRSRGVFRKTLALMGASHAVKAVALSLGSQGLWLFLIAEVARSGAASALAAYYAGSVLRP